MPDAARKRCRHSQAAGVVLLTLASGQFLMTLDSSVMNVSIATVAKDVGTTVTGIQTAITFYTLVMAALMITGGKVGGILGRKRAFAIGCVIYGTGSFTTAIAPNLTVLIIGWSVLEGIGAALIMPAIVALVASNFGPSGATARVRARRRGRGDRRRRRAAHRRALHHLPVVAARVRGRGRDRARDPAARRAGWPTRRRIPTRASTSSAPRCRASGLSLVVFGILKAGTWGVIQPKDGAPVWLGLSPVIWLFTIGAVVLGVFVLWEQHRIDRGEGALIDPAMFKIPQLRGGLTAFFFQFLLQMGLFFVVPAVPVGRARAVGGGDRRAPAAALAHAPRSPPSASRRFFPHANPRRVVRFGFLTLLIGLVVLIALLDEGAGPEIITWPMLLAGLGIGALASQLGAVTVGAVPDEQTDEVGGLQNTFTNLGASIGTALAGAVLIAALTSSFLTGIKNDPDVPNSVSNQAQVELSSGIPFVSDADLEDALADADVPPETADAIVDENAEARIDGLRAALAVLALIAVVALFATWRICRHPSEHGDPVSRVERRWRRR